jgi:hypothetical protein
MANKQKNRHTRTSTPSAPTPFEEARDELFQHIMQCDVVGAHPEDQESWFTETLSYLEGRYPELNKEQLSDLRKLGTRFAQPPKRREENGTASAA